MNKVTTDQLVEFLKTKDYITSKEIADTLNADVIKIRQSLDNIALRCDVDIDKTIMNNVMHYKLTRHNNLVRLSKNQILWRLALFGGAA